MNLFSSRTFRLLTPLLAGGALIAAVACGTTTETVVQTVIVEKEVAGDTVVQTVVVEKEVAGKTVIQTVEVEKIVEKSVVQTVVVTEKGDTVQVVVTATATAIPTVAGIEPVKPPSPQSGTNSAVIAIFEILDENGRGQAQSPDFLKNFGLAETMFARNSVTDATEPWLAKSWTIATDLSGATIDIETNAEFQWINDSGVVENFGKMTAEDVAFSMNDANATTNPESIHGQAGDFAGLWGAWNVVDADTVSFDFAVNPTTGKVLFDATWNADYTNESGQAFSVFSKSVFDSKGPDFARDNVVGTGVYLVESWARSDILDMVGTKAAGGNAHWKFTPKTDRIKFIEVTESTTRSALLKTGEVDVASIDPKDVPQFVQGGFLTSSTGGLEQVGIFFSGNLWETVSAVDGSPLTRGTFVHDLAWIGNPADAEDLQEAKSVRNALARAVDREAVNQKLLAGLGHNVEVMYVSVKHSRWQDKWNYGYDPDLAIEILRGENADWPINSDGNANYQKGQTSDSQQDQLNGNSFSVSLYAQGAGGGLGLGGEITDAAAGYWADLGLQVFTLKFSYVTFRPTTVGRTNTHPWVTACDKGNEAWPWHFPKGLVQTSLTRGGFGCGFEIPFVLDNYQRVAVEPDEAVRNSLIDDYVQYMYDEALQPGIVATPSLWVMNPIKVKSWDQGKVTSSGINRVWNLELN
ncbi:MAG: hypothetical protein HQ478_10265 [Chloroflexi bacterium]|nr:hypothetical protein [Chloroflexota bacterium]